MATAAKKTAAVPQRKPITNATRLADPAAVVERTEGETIKLATTLPDEESEPVTVIIPKDYTLMLDNGHPVKYTAGVQEMPVNHATHWWSRANGVKIYDKGAK